MWLGRLTLFIFLYLGTSNYASGLDLHNQTFSAKVIRIVDGDTFEILYQNVPIMIRLAHIDCPEKSGTQPFGKEAKKALSDLCFNQNVIIYGQHYDRYRRLIAVVVNFKKQVLNQQMIRLGLAWHFKKYSSNLVYAGLEIEARKRKVGIWSVPHPIAPWLWRKRKYHFPY